MAYKFQRGNAILSGALEQEGNITIDGGKLTASAGFEGASLTIQGSAIVSNAKALGNVTTISGASSLSAAKLTINGSDIVTQAKALGNVTTVSGASRISGNDLRLGGGTTTIAADGVVTAAGAVRGSELSGTEGVKTAKLFIDNQEVISQARAVQNVTAVSGAGAIQGNSLELGGGTATISSAGAVAGTSVSGTVKLESAKLEIDGAVIITQGRGLQNVTSITGAGKIEGALLDLNGSTVITQARALQNVISISGAGQIQGNDLRLGGGKATISAGGAVAATSVSGTTQLESANLRIDNSIVINQGRQLQNITEATIGNITDTRLVFGGPNGKLVDNHGFTIATGSNGHILTLSGTKAAGGIHSEIHFGNNKTILSYLSGTDGGEPEHQLKLGTSDNDVEVAISASHGGGMFLAGGDGAEGGVYVTGVNGFKLEDASENVNIELKPAGRISGSENLLVGGTVRLDGVADTAVNQAADSIYFLDSDNLVKRDTIVDFVAAIAGAGLSAGSGKLSTQGSAVATQFNSNQALSEGYNVYTGSSNVTVQLEDRPAGNLTAGDIFIVKQGASGKVTISSSSPETTIDGESGSVELESPFAAVNLLFVDYGRGGPKFRIV
jgi:hypothetical protein